MGSSGMSFQHRNRHARHDFRIRRNGVAPLSRNIYNPDIAAKSVGVRVRAGGRAGGGGGWGGCLKAMILHTEACSVSCLFVGLLQMCYHPLSGGITLLLLAFTWAAPLPCVYITAQSVEGEKVRPEPLHPVREPLS